MEFECEDLLAEMLGIADADRENVEAIDEALREKYGIDVTFESVYPLIRDLLMHTLAIEGGLRVKSYHAFVSRKAKIMLMRTEATKES